MISMRRNFSLADQRFAKVVNQTINVSKFPKTYEMEVVGDSLRPFAESGATLTFSKAEKPVRGDLVALCFRPDLEELKLPGAVPTIVKRLAKSCWVLSERLPYTPRRGYEIPEIVCETTNPVERLSIPINRLIAVHKCVEIHPRGSQVQAPMMPAAQLKARGYLHA